MKKRCLVVVDYQADFVTGSLGCPAALAIESALAKHIDLRRAQGDDIIFTMDTHEPDYLTTHEGQRLPIAHCLVGTKGHALYGAVGDACKPEDMIIQKETFGSKGLFEHLRRNQYDEVELCGVVTNICVIANAVLARTALPEAEVAVNASLCASGDEELHHKTLDVMSSMQIDIRTA